MDEPRYLLLDTSTPLCRLTILDGYSAVHPHEWQADRQLAAGVLRFITESLAAHDLTIHDLAGLGVYRGPGSFTGLRIGLTAMNTLATSLAIPIVGATGDDWQPTIEARLWKKEDDRVVLPSYGADAHITQQKK